MAKRDLIQGMIILQVIGSLDTNDNWLVQWFSADARHERYFEYFEDVSRFVEGELLNDGKLREI